MYNALHSNDGQLVAAVADMNIFDSMDSSRVSIFTMTIWNNPFDICYRSVPYYKTKSLGSSVLMVISHLN